MRLFEPTNQRAEPQPKTSARPNDSKVSPRIYLGMSDTGPLFAGDEICCLVLGPPRSGKTTSLIIPNVLLAGGPVISVSTKSDVFEATFNTRRKSAKCLVFDPTEALELPSGAHRVGWSPLSHSRRWERAVMSAEAMVGTLGTKAGHGEAHWLERAGALCSALFHAAALEELPMAKVAESVNRRDAGLLMAALSRHDANLAADLLSGILETDAREQSGIWSTASRVLAAYRTDASIKSAELPSIDWHSFLAEPSTLYIASPADHQLHVAPLVAGLLRDLRSHCYAAANSANANERDDVLLLLDELANIAPLHDLPALIAEGSSQGILTLASLQDLSQARARWGVEGEGFLSLFGAKVILGGIGDRNTLTQLSTLAGDHYLRSVSQTKRRHLGRFIAPGTQIQMTRAPRLSPDEVASPPPGVATVFLGARAFRSHLVPCYLP